MKYQSISDLTAEVCEGARHDSRFSVAICTHNRPQMLETLLGRLVPQLLSRNVPLIVIDSASADPARSLNREIVERWPGATLLRLEEPGVSRARNAALQMVRTDWLAFIDDDEDPTTTWAFDVEALIDRLPDECAACGGNVVPIWPDDRTPSIGRRWRNYLSLIDQKGEYNQRTTPRFGIGHSIVRVDVIRAIGGFDVRLGRDGASLLSGEEVLLVDRLHGAGWEVWHSDRISVGHRIEPDRLHRKWAINRAYWEGVSVARTYSIESSKVGTALRRGVQKKIIGLRLCTLLAGEKFDFDLRLAFAMGVLNEHIRLRYTD